MSAPEPLNKTLHYVYTWTDGQLIHVKHFYAPSLVEADKQFKETFGSIPAGVRVDRYNS